MERLNTQAQMYTGLLIANLKQMRPVAAELLHVSALLAPGEIPEELFTQGAPAFAETLREVAQRPSILGRAIEDLLAYKLIELHPSAHTLRVDTKISSILRDAASSREQQYRIEQIIHALHLILLSSADTNFARANLFIPHIQHIAALSESWTFSFPEAAEVFSWAAKRLCEQELYEDAERLLRSALAVYEHLYEDVDPTVVTALDDLANMYKTQQKYEEAQELLTRAYLIRMRTLGLDHPDTILTLCDIAYVYAAQGLIVEAEMLYKRGLANCDSVLGPEHPFTLIVLDNLASLCIERAKAAEDEADKADEDEVGEDEEAETLLQSIDSLYARVRDAADVATAKVLHKLALAYVALGQLEQAETAYKQVIAVYESATGSIHPDTAQCQEQLAFLCLQQGRANEAEAYLRQTLQTREQALGLKHLDVAASLNNLGLFYITQEKFEQAEQLLERALAICADSLGEDHSAVVISLNNLITAYLGQEKQQQAKLLLLREQQVLEKLLGPEHPDVVAVREHYQKLKAS